MLDTAGAVASIGATIEDPRKLGTAAWEKVDGAGRALGSSVWTWTSPTGTITVTDCAAATDLECVGLDTDRRPGYFLLTGLQWGRHTLTETTPPAGYVLNPANTWAFDIDANALAAKAPAAFVNVPGARPPLPLAGGAFTLVMLAASALFVAGLLTFAAKASR